MLKEDELIESLQALPRTKPQDVEADDIQIHRSGQLKKENKERIK